MTDFIIFKVLEQSNNYFEYQIFNRANTKFHCYSSVKLESLDNSILSAVEINNLERVNEIELFIEESDKLFNGQVCVKLIQIKGELAKEGIGQIGNLLFEISEIPGDLVLGDHLKFDYQGLQISNL